METASDTFIISTDKSRLDVDAIHSFLSTESYWAQNRSRQQTETAIENSICFGAYNHDRLVGFGRVVSDCATFAYVGDVFVIEEYRGRGIGKRLMDAMLGHPDLQNLRRWILATRDAHTVYSRHGFSALAHPERWMERPAPDAY
jgi:GNAT superfamily N-acetyltransferase